MHQSLDCLPVGRSDDGLAKEIVGEETPPEWRVDTHAAAILITLVLPHYAARSRNVVSFSLGHAIGCLPGGPGECPQPEPRRCLRICWVARIRPREFFGLAPIPWTRFQDLTGQT